MATKANAYIKTRKFLLTPQDTLAAQMLPKNKSLRQGVQQLQGQCRTEQGRWLHCLTQAEQELYKALPSENNFHPSEMAQAVQTVQATANTHLLHELYPHQFMELYARLTPLFDNSGKKVQAPSGTRASSTLKKWC